MDDISLVPRLSPRANEKSKRRKAGRGLGMRQGWYSTAVLYHLCRNVQKSPRSAHYSEIWITELGLRSWVLHSPFAVVLSMKATGKHTVGVCYCDMNADRTRLAHNVCTERRLTSHFCEVRELITTLLNWDNSTVICPVKILITLLDDMLPYCMWQVLSMTRVSIWGHTYTPKNFECFTLAVFGVHSEHGVA